MRGKKFEYVRNCTECGKCFETNRPQKLTCSAECAAKRQRQLQSIYKKNNRATVYPEKHKNTTKQLNKIAMLAWNQGTSYGKYVAAMECQVKVGKHNA